MFKMVKMEEAQFTCPTELSPALFVDTESSRVYKVVDR
jgi:hypothetical protein